MLVLYILVNFFIVLSVPVCYNINEKDAQIVSPLFQNEVMAADFWELLDNTDFRGNADPRKGLDTRNYSNNNAGLAKK